MAATRLTPGAISVSNSSHLPAIVSSWLMKPVIFPPGRGRLATKPSPTGSERGANTIGIVRVSRCNAAVAGVPCARITSGCSSSNSFADIRIRSTLPAAQRTSTCRSRLLVQPNSASPCVNRRGRPLPRDRLHRTPSEHRPAACGRAAAPAPRAATPPPRCRAKR